MEKTIGNDKNKKYKKNDFSLFLIFVVSIKFILIVRRKLKKSKK